MDFRTHVYSPIQNQALWLAANLYGHESFDDTEYALTELGGAQHMAGNPFGIAPVLKLIRNYTAGFRQRFSAQPALAITLAGPGTPVGLPAGTPAALAATNSGGAIIVSTDDARAYGCLVPTPLPEGTQWLWFELDGYPPAPAYLLPGEADQLLTQATNEAATLIDDARRYLGVQVTSELSNPRLTVGTLTDYYEAPGLPDSIAPRAAKLIARADRVSAIVETVTSTIGDHVFDPQLLGLGRHIRQARMSAVTYATVEWARDCTQRAHDASR